MIRKFLFAAVSVSFLFGAGAMAADAPKAPKLTSAVAKALTDAQKAGNAKDYPTAQAALEKAKAVASPTPEPSTTSAIKATTRIWLLDSAKAALGTALSDPDVLPGANSTHVLTRTTI